MQTSSHVFDHEHCPINKMSPVFKRCVGIDYSGAVTPASSLKNLRIYEADQLIAPREVAPPPSPRRYWTRRGIAEWLVARLCEGPATLVGIDHAFSFPLRYFEKYSLPLDWPHFLNDFQRHWPTDDHIYVDFVRDGSCGNAAARCGDSHWRRITELRTGAKSVFHFDVPGSVATSTHAGLPWLRYIRNHTVGKVNGIATTSNASKSINVACPGARPPGVEERGDFQLASVVTESARVKADSRGREAEDD